jgi:hypothetical protein
MKFLDDVPFFGAGWWGGENVGTFRVKRLGVWVKTLRRF